MNEQANDFISGIFNYCDRWCERCPLTTRCRVYAMEQEYADETTDAGQPAFARNLQNIFAETKEMLREAAAEKGINIDALDLREAGEAVERKRRRIQQQDLLKLAEKYTKQASAYLQAQDLSNSETIELVRLEMWQIIGWYHFFIWAKINRGLHAEDESFDADARAEIGCGDGSIKVALIAIDRSINAWKILLESAAEQREIQPMIRLLDALRRECEGKFPNARSFIRPGFDELETVM